VDLVRLEEKLELVRRADYFTILGVGRDATPHALRDAADRLLASFAAEGFPGPLEPELERKLAEIREVVSEARAILVDDELRAEYLAGLGEGPRNAQQGVAR